MKRRSVFTVNSDYAAQNGMKERIVRIIRRPRTQRWAAVLAAVVLIAATILSFSTGEPEQKIAQVELPKEAEREMLFSADGEKMYVLMDGTLYARESGIWQALGGFENISLMACGAGRVYLCENGEENSTVHVIGAHGERMEDLSLPEGIRPVHLFGAGELLGLVAESEKGYGLRAMQAGRGYVLDPLKGSLSPLPFDEVYGMCADGQGRICALADDGAAWRLMRMSEGGDAERLMEVPRGTYREIAVARDGLYLLGMGGNVTFMPQDGGPKREILQKGRDSVGEISSIYAGDGVLFARDRDGQGRYRLLRVDIGERDAKAQRTLTILNWSGDTDEVALHMREYFSGVHPEVRIEHIDSGNYDWIAAALMAGNPMIDIIGDSTANVYGMNLAGSGALKPLSEMPRIAAAMEEAGFVPYEQAASIGGEVYTVPRWNRTFMFELNESLLVELGLEWPEAPYTWAELADWGVANLSGTGYYLTNFGNVYGSPMSLYLDYMVQRHGTAQLDSPEFRELMDAWKHMVRAGIIYQSGIVPEDVGTRMAARFAAEPRTEGDLYRPFPTVEGNTLSYMMTWGLHVNGTSPNMDLIEEYLVHYVSAQVQNLNPYGWYENMLLEDTSGYDRAAYRDGDRPFGVYGPVLEGLRLGSFANAVQYDHNALMHEIEVNPCPMLMAYFTDEITLDEYIAFAQGRIDMVMHE